jgi:ATP-dependent DNA ligase
MQQCTGLAHLRAELKDVEAKGGEGLMLRQPKSIYAHGTRSKTLLKVTFIRWFPHMQQGMNVWQRKN